LPRSVVEFMTSEDNAIIEFIRVIPVFRIFSEEKAKEFYIDYLGFKIDWEHRFEPGMPLYMRVSLGNLILHLSEHHGDGSPGACLHVEMKGIREFHDQLNAKNYKFLRPGLQHTEWGTTAFDVIDPFGNRISFNELDKE
jgi:uncharacterized glyoxalase superfamily protein PhnB